MIILLLNDFSHVLGFFLSRTNMIINFFSLLIKGLIAATFAEDINQEEYVPFQGLSEFLC